MASDQQSPAPACAESGASEAALQVIELLIHRLVERGLVDKDAVIDDLQELASATRDGGVSMSGVGARLAELAVSLAAVREPGKPAG